MIEVGNKKDEMKRNYGWLDTYICYTGYNSKPFKIDDVNYQIKCLCNIGGWTVNKFKIIYINFNLKELNISEEVFLSHFVMPGHITEFYIQYDKAKKINNLVYAYCYYGNKKFMPDKYGRYNMIYEKLDKFKTQDKAKIDIPNPNYYNPN